MQPPLVDYADLFRLEHFFDILAAVVFVVPAALIGLAEAHGPHRVHLFAVITDVGAGFGFRICPCSGGK